jgi:hypothetical protein
MLPAEGWFLMVREYDPDYDPTLPLLPDYAEEEAADARHQREQARIAWAEAEWERQLAEEAAAAAQEAEALAAQEAAATAPADAPAAQEVAPPLLEEAFVVALDDDEQPEEAAITYPSLPQLLTVRPAPPKQQRRRKQPLKRPAPTIKQVAPLPDSVTYAKTGGHQAAIYEAMTTTDDPLAVAQAGINALVELRHELQKEAPVGGLNRLPSQLMLEPLWGSVPMWEEVAGIESVLRCEISALVQTLELVPFVQRGPFRAAMEQARHGLLAEQQMRLEDVVERLRQRVKQRGAVRRIATIIKQIAWDAMRTLGADMQQMTA